MIKNNIIRISLIVIMIIVSLVAVMYFSTPVEIRGMRKVSEYNHIGPSYGPACQAFMPECGVCPGKVYEKSCYVDR